MEITPAQYDLGLGSLRCLPYEVREMILGHLLDTRPDEGYYPRDQGLTAKEQHSRILGHDGGTDDLYANGSIEEFRHSPYKLCTEILRASKAFHIEASNYLYNRNGMIRIVLPMFNDDPRDPMDFNPFSCHFECDDAATLLACQRFVLHVDVKFADSDPHNNAYFAVSSSQANAVIKYLSLLLSDDEDGCTIRIVLPHQTESVCTNSNFLSPWLWLQCYETVDILSETEDVRIIQRTAEELGNARQLSLHRWNVATCEDLDFIEQIIAGQSGHMWRVHPSIARYCNHITKYALPVPKPSDDFLGFSIHMRANFWLLISDTQGPDGLDVSAIDAMQVVKLIRWVRPALTSLLSRVIVARNSDVPLPFQQKWSSIFARIGAECSMIWSDWEKANVLYSQILTLPFYPRALSDTADRVRDELESSKDKYRSSFGHDWALEPHLEAAMRFT